MLEIYENPYVAYKVTTCLNFVWVHEANVVKRILTFITDSIKVKAL